MGGGSLVWGFKRTSPVVCLARNCGDVSTFLFVAGLVWTQALFDMTVPGMFGVKHVEL